VAPLFINRAAFLTPRNRLVLPANFSDFLNPEFTDDWAVMFSHLTTCHLSDSDSTDIFQLGRAGLPRPLQNILYLLQILSPGLLLVRSMATDEDEVGEWGPQGMRPASDSATCDSDILRP
jgi:hypothetical protein